MKAPDVLGGLELVSLPRGGAWYVAHAVSKAAAMHGYLRQRRFAEQARADLLATGVDFTGTPEEIGEQRERWRGTYELWTTRARQECIDLRTGEHYSYSTHYGQVIPSEAHARELAAALACFVWS